MLTLHSRHRLDIAFRHFLYALSACVWARYPQRLSARLAGGWSPSGHGIACRSVRSGFHLLLDALDLDAGDEVLVSAVTHPDMVRILEAHGLVAVPVDLDIGTLAPSLDSAERLVTERTRAILVAHLFGGRFDMGAWWPSRVATAFSCGRTARRLSPGRVTRATRAPMLRCTALAR
jgi:perosamine synthetase